MKSFIASILFFLSALACFSNAKERRGDNTSEKSYSRATFIYAKLANKNFLLGNTSSSEHHPILVQKIKKHSIGFFFFIKKTDKDWRLSFWQPEQCPDFLYSTYSFIFNFLYPKHVFW